MQMSEEITDWTAGMIEFRKKLIQPAKDAKNPFFRSKYVTLEGTINSADNAFKEMAKESGLTFAQEVTSDTSTATISVMTLISHVSGQWVMFGPFNVPAGKKKDGSVDAQTYGSSTTYAKRYALSAALGIASDIDDDGNGASSNGSNANSQSSRRQAPARQQSKPASNKISPAMEKQLETMINNISDLMQIPKSEVRTKTLRHFKASKFSDMTTTTADNALVYLGKALDKAKDISLENQSNEFENKQPTGAGANS
ncbi:ERF family protein [Companilactobacillus mishanensis]|uniref:Single-stranded DNA-binding protein n=1 Tax=Companilactobacillus mishanensis TaxID=2486008 RepID=A0A5P0ZEZ7_9LACO|nr:ERF family protein [Companilactobacillus mishanensis]MQS44273.1 single-stranded DNA-binding protein [Companilactobacillus mishanensis]MQS51624.1 single-stranded DNA-binding protein [Companilactobacillus mishanensis]